MLIAMKAKTLIFDPPSPETNIFKGLK